MKEGSGIRVHIAKRLTLADIHARSTEEGHCLLWGGQKTPKGFPYAYMGRDKVNLRPYVYGLLGKRQRNGYVISVRCGHRDCLSEHCLMEKSVSQVRKDVHAKLRNDPIAYAKTRHGIQAAGLTKLDMGKAAEIRQSSKPSKELAKDYGCSVRAIQEIRAGKTYIAPRVATSVFNLAQTMGAL